MQNETFQALMVRALSEQTDIKGRTILELGADPSFESAKAMLERGAGAVISSDLNDVWHGATCPGVVTATIDARNIEAALPRGSVDIVYGINIMEHLPDLPACMESIARVLKPGGMAFLHGHPIWTSSRGHHALLGNPVEGWELHYASETNPIPLWGHLTMTPDELRSHLSDKPKAVADEAVKWAFESDLITRTPRRKMTAEITSGPLNVRAIWEDRLEAPDEATLAKIKRTKWWDENEDYSVRGITYLLDAC